MAPIKPIIQSLLDTDFYKFTMGQLAFLRYPEIPVKYDFTNRTRDVNLAKFIAEQDLRRELDAVRDLRFDNSELHYLRGTNEYGERMFCEEYLQFLKNLKLPTYHLEYREDGFSLEFSGSWSTAIYWEIYALAIINELYNRAQLSEMSGFEQELVFAQGRLNLGAKIRLLGFCPELTFTDFGTRRRFSREWHDYVVKILQSEIPESQFRGTSNVYLAMKYGLVPMGTSAHEMFMVMSGIWHASDRDIRDSHNQTLLDWWRQYDYGLSIALTDTYGSDFFFQDLTTEQAKKWKGLRQDSGDPLVFGEKAIRFYESRQIDPREKLIVFSDGLEAETMIRLQERFRGRIKVTFGWGTNLTNDLGLRPLSLVVKAVEANGHGLVKLSDNLAKAIGRPEDVARFKRIFGYTNGQFNECKY